jgi:hypothetical protein
MLWLFVVVAVVAVVIIGFVVVGRETSIQAARARPAVFELEEAVTFIADVLPEDVASRLTHDDVRWVLRTDVDLLEEATVERDTEGIRVVGEDQAIARILGAAGAADRDLSDADVVAVLDARSRYLEAIGAIGPEVLGPDEPQA